MHTWGKLAVNRHHSNKGKREVVVYFSVGINGESNGVHFHDGELGNRLYSFLKIPVSDLNEQYAEAKQVAAVLSALLDGESVGGSLEIFLGFGVPEKAKSFIKSAVSRVTKVRRQEIKIHTKDSLGRGMVMMWVWQVMLLVTV